MSSKPIYSSNLGNKAALVSETMRVLAEYAHSGSVRHVRDLVLKDNLLLKRTVSTRRRVWETIFTRYFSGRDPESTATIARIANSFLPERARYLILFYELAKSAPLVYDLTVDCLYGLYEQGRSTVTKSDILAWIEAAEAAGHEEIAGWSPQTRGKVASNYLTIARDFGLLEGTQQKTFSRVFVPLPTFVYVLYRLRDEGLSIRAIVESLDFRLFLLDERDVSLLLDETTRAGYVTFQQAGDIYDLTFHYDSMTEVVDELTRQV